MAPTLGYWKLRGLAQHIKLLLAYTETDYNNKMYTFGPAPDFDRSSWFNEKFTLGLDFPNVPYYIDGDVKLTQSQAITNYIARKNNLAGTTEEERIRIDLATSQVQDLRMNLIRLVYLPGFETNKPEYLKTYPQKLKEMSDFLGSRTWFAGDNITYVDFIIYELFDVNRHLVPNCCDQFANIKQFMDRFENLPAIKKYLASPECIKRPFNGPTAAWGGQ